MSLKHRRKRTNSRLSEQCPYMFQIYFPIFKLTTIKHSERKHLFVVNIFDVKFCIRVIRYFGLEDLEVDSAVRFLLLKVFYIEILTFIPLQNLFVECEVHGLEFGEQF